MQNEIQMLVADYLAGRAVVVRKSADPEGFTVQSPLRDGGTQLDICSGMEIEHMARHRLAEEPKRVARGTIGSTQVLRRNDDNVTPIGIEAPANRAESDRPPTATEVAANGTRWLPGMLTDSGARVVEVDAGVLWLVYQDEGKVKPGCVEDFKPSRTDRATGILLAAPW